MTKPDSTDFPVTREILDHLDSWLNPMAALLPHPTKEPLEKGGFFWVYPLKSAEVVQIAKAVRMVSGFHAAWRLADDGFVVECYTVLRFVADFAAEIMFLAEGILAGTLNSSQQKFIRQFFTTFATDPDKLAAREREQYVDRNKIAAARIRLLHKGPDAEKIGRIIKFLNKTYDSYVHGAYESAMQLFSGKTHQFMLRGHHSPRECSVAKAGISAKLPEALVALEFMAITRDLKDIVRELATARHHLLDSNEQLAPP